MAFFLPFRLKNGVWSSVCPYTFHASIVLYIIDPDTIWFEVDSIKSDPLFWKGNFNGKELVYWQAKKVDETKSQ